MKETFLRKRKITGPLSGMLLLKRHQRESQELEWDSCKWISSRKPIIKITFKFGGIILIGFYRNLHAQHHLRQCFVHPEYKNNDEILYGFYKSLY